MAWYEDIIVGALGPGVNAPTIIALNVVIGLAVLSLLSLLTHSIFYNPVLTPHVIVLLLLAFGLWASINWLVSNLGLTDAEEQHKQVFGQAAEEQPTADEPEPAEDSVADDQTPDDSKKDN
ncbi:hypothetical protein TSOC_008718 [Tetrabaena socialis]|uniref:Uncharacterized protein n=1 Tax=Tetrabaena socialis TaxID=47790 RepID=A0A2J7ZXR2_9CHLO|nr:hypothetical protein TSOC_008718 [Tetrabaena socialis]|eukprot:PNH05054.1 hypothetical protein TSOC_008718 [Tetrabaena socialis]